MKGFGPIKINTPSGVPDNYNDPRGRKMISPILEANQKPEFIQSRKYLEKNSTRRAIKSSL